MDRTNESVCADASKDERCSIACSIGGLSLPTACIGVKNGTRSRENPADQSCGPFWLGDRGRNGVFCRVRFGVLFHQPAVPEAPHLFDDRQQCGALRREAVLHAGR